MQAFVDPHVYGAAVLAPPMAPPPPPAPMQKSLIGRHWLSYVRETGQRRFEEGERNVQMLPDQAYVKFQLCVKFPLLLQLSQPDLPCHLLNYWAMHLLENGEHPWIHVCDHPHPTWRADASACQLLTFKVGKIDETFTTERAMFLVMSLLAGPYAISFRYDVGQWDVLEPEIVIGELQSGGMDFTRQLSVIALPKESVDRSKPYFQRCEMPTMETEVPIEFAREIGIVHLKRTISRVEDEPSGTRGVIKKMIGQLPEYLNKDRDALHKVLNFWCAICQWKIPSFSVYCEKVRYIAMGLSKVTFRAAHPDKNIDLQAILQSTMIGEVGMIFRSPTLDLRYTAIIWGEVTTLRKLQLTDSTNIQLPTITCSTERHGFSARDPDTVRKEPLPPPYAGDMNAQPLVTKTGLQPIGLDYSASLEKRSLHALNPEARDFRPTF